MRPDSRMGLDASAHRDAESGEGRGVPEDRPIDDPDDPPVVCGAGDVPIDGVCVVDDFFVEGSDEGEPVEGGGDGFTLDADACFTLPLATYVIGGYHHGSNVGGGRVHAGDDVSASVGTDVFSIDAGTVRFAGPAGTWGTLVEIDHVAPDGTPFISLYGHLRSTDLQVQKGQRVARGQLIGRIGNRSQNGGWAPHLHFSIFTGTHPATGVLQGHVVSLSGYEDPIPWMTAHGSDRSCMVADGRLTAASVVGRTLDVSGEVSAPDGIERWSLVVGQDRIHTATPAGVDELSFSESIDLAPYGLVAGAHSLGLWVKPNDAAAVLVDSRVIDVVDAPACDGTFRPYCDGDELRERNLCDADRRVRDCDHGCEDGACVLPPGCVGGCPALDRTRCSGDQVQTCRDPDGDGCPDWSAALDCPQGQACSGDRCAAIVVDPPACVAGCPALNSTRCDGDRVQTCRDPDGDGCPDWSAALDCPQGQACTVDRCAAIAANPTVCDESVVGRVGSQQGQTDGDSRDAGACGGRGGEQVVRFTAPEAGQWTFDTDGSGYDTVLHVRSRCDDAATELACDDDSGQGTASRIQLGLQANQTVYIFVDGFDGNGAWTLDINRDRPCPGNCSGHGQCDGATGTCDCDPGYDGADCSIAPPPDCRIVRVYPAAAGSWTAGCSVPDEEIYKARATNPAGNRTTFTFAKCQGGGGPSADVRYWVVTGLERPERDRLCIRDAGQACDGCCRTTGIWRAGQAELTVRDVPIWPDEGWRDLNGEEKHIYIQTAGGGHPESYWFRPQRAVTFRVECE